MTARPCLHAAAATRPTRNQEENVTTTDQTAAEKALADALAFAASSAQLSALWVARAEQALTEAHRAVRDAEAELEDVRQEQAETAAKAARMIATAQQVLAEEKR